MNDFIGMPISANANANAEISKKITIHDDKTFKQEESKIEEVGRINKRKFVFNCGGSGPSTWIEAIGKDEEIKRFHELMKKGIISEEQFKKFTNKVMGIDQ